MACPGRLLDLREQGFYKADGIEYLVLDEADRMLDMGFAREVKRIVADISPRRQTILFSATMPDSVMSLANSLMKNPVEVKVDPVSSTAEKVRQSLCFVQKKEKRNLLKSDVGSTAPKGFPLPGIYSHETRSQPCCYGTL